MVRKTICISDKTKTILDDYYKSQVYSGRFLRRLVTEGAKELEKNGSTGQITITISTKVNF